MPVISKKKKTTIRAVGKHDELCESFRLYISEKYPKWSGLVRRVLPLYRMNKYRPNRKLAH